MKIKKTNRLLAAFISLCMVVGMLPATAFAEGQTAKGLCEHHLEHTAECGYGAEQPCVHEHSEDCYTDKLICGYDEETETTASDSDAEHTHTQECYALDCPHERGEHDADCGYAEAQPCGYTCELCGKTDNEPEPKPGEETGQAACTLTEGCTLPTGHEGECVTEPGESEKETACTLTEGCTLPDGHEGECVTELPPVDGALVKTITSWTFVGDDNLNEGELPLPGVSMERQADFDTVVSMLPTGISAEIEGETEPSQVDITGWSCPEYVQDENGNWLITGEYVFTAKLRSGYSCDPLPAVKVLLGGAELYASPTTVGDFLITGDASGYTFNAPELVIHNGASLTIQNTNPEMSTTHTIKVDSGATNVNITLAGVNINVSSKSLTGGRDACAFDMTGATVNLILAADSTNILNSNSLYAGLEVPAGANLTIDGSGTLKSMSYNGGGNGAGIGGGYSGRGSNGGKITIQGGAQVTATSNGGAGIGGGYNGHGGEITIQGGAQVTATGHLAAGIGGGYGGNGGKITIQGSAKVTATSNSGAGIGGGYSGNGGNVIISGQKTHVTVNSIEARDIGGGAGDTDGGSLSVTGGATLEMQNGGTNAKNPEYRNCTLIQNGNSTEYNAEGKPIASPTLSLEASPAGSVVLPNTVTLTATLSGAAGGLSGKTVTFTGSGSRTATTNDSGVATYTYTSLTQGTYSFGASFASDTENKSAEATPINDYEVSLGTQEALGIIGLDNTYTYGDEPFNLSISGGSGDGAVSYVSSDLAVASVTGNTVTIQKAGTFTITATKAADDNYAEAKVTSGTVTVNPATPGISLTATGGTNINDPIVLTATVSKIGTGATPAGTVTFKEENAILEENVALDGSGKATCTVSNLTVGNHTYTAAYSGQSGYYNAASADRTVGVGLADQTGFAISDPGAKTYGDNEFTLTAAGGQSSGGVSYSAPDGNGVLTVAADGKVTVTGAGKVTVTATKAGDDAYNQVTDTLEITVAPRDIANVTINVTGSRVYTGSQLQPVFGVKDGSIAITTGDYTNEYGSNVDTGANTGSIKLTGQRNYTGTKTATFDIEKRSLTGAVIALASGPYTIKGGAVTPAVTNVVVDGIIVPATAYDVGYTNNTAVGTATVAITAKSNGNFSGTASATFEITKSNSSSGGGDNASDSSDSSDSNVTIQPVKPTDNTPNPPTTVVIQPEGKVDENGVLSIEVTDKDVQNAIDKAIAQAQKDNVEGGGIAVSIDLTGVKTQFHTSKTAYEKLVAADVKNLDIHTPQIALSLDLATLKTIRDAVSGDVTINAVKADDSSLPDELYGRTAYDITIISGGKAISQFGGYIVITLPYTLKADEQGDNLQMVYVDADGKVQSVSDSSYDANQKAVIGRTNHFTVFGVVEKPDSALSDIAEEAAPVFTDIAGHWAKEDILFVAKQNLLSGTSENIFSPDIAMTRGMFVTALGRLAGVNPASYQTYSFTDVKADVYYAPYVEWAAQNNIVNGTGEGLFSPNAPVTREQMAVMMTNYAGQMGYSIPTPLGAVAFADNDNISAWAAKEVAAMQQAGILMGRDNNRFNPNASATRAEVSAVLRRFVEIVIDPVTAQD